MFDPVKLLVDMLRTDWFSNTHTWTHTISLCSIYYTDQKVKKN